ncbi:hypothetical protein CCACVL1_11018 [Corchorus capsularis]|uniref:Uncharacterized protein n=1 Tax=Corchorus capsularis TaxID=210143 RepID=A0A1R3INB1_COCAP|nr:hypothetical protein CCACVL1_11018 [Corchorus capsularis]
MDQGKYNEKQSTLEHVMPKIQKQQSKSSTECSSIKQ